MEENNDNRSSQPEPEEPPKPWMDTIPNEFNTARRKEQIFKETMLHLQTDKEIQQYFAQFQPRSIDSFITGYAWRKAGWVVSREQNEYWLEQQAMETMNDAREHLGNIQQKKLFEKQCLWRAEQFTHPAIETTVDFMYWEYNVLNCPFLDPITKDDIDLYIEYLNIYTGEELAFLASWQDYNTYNSNHPTVSKNMHPPEQDEDEDTESDEMEEENDMRTPRIMPPWYIFYDERRGTSHYLQLPDKRQEKEWFYSRLAHAEQQKKWAEHLEKNPPDKRPHLWCNNQGDELIAFIKRFDKDDGVLEAYHAWQQFLNNPEEEKAMYWVKEAFYHLRDCFESFPIVPDIADWKEALIATAKLWNRTKIIRAIPLAFDEYLMQIDCLVEHPYDRKQALEYRKRADDHKVAILRGRELSGEPFDLNF